MPRLQGVFQDTLSSPVTLIVAGAGYGKTTNVADFLRDSSVRTVWLTLDILDQDENRILDYLIEGFRRATGIESWASAGRPRDLGPEALAELFITDLQERVFGRTVVVIDEFDQIAAERERSLAFFSRLVNYLPDVIRLWIISRRDPPLATQKLRSTGVIRTLDEDALRWGIEEVRNLSQMLGPRLGDREVEAVSQMTGGRAATIRIILESLAARRLDEKKLTELLRNPTLEIRRYIEEEVLPPSGTPTRATLSRIAIPEEIDTAVLGEALNIPDLDAQIDELQRESSLLRATATPGVFRLDPMIRSVLLRIAKAELGADAVRRIRHSLGLAYLAHDQVMQAVPVLLEAGDSEAAAKAVAESGAEMLAQGNSATLRQLLELFPKDEVQKDPMLLHLHARALLIEGRFADATEKYQTLTKLTNAPKQLLAWAYQGLCESAYRRNLLDDARRFATQLERLFDSADPFAKAKILNDKAILDLRSGRYEEAREKWEKALALSFDPAAPADFHKNMLHNLTLPTAATGHITAAKSYFERLVTPEAEPQKQHEIVAYLNLARIALMQGDLPTAERDLEVALHGMEQYKIQSFLRAETMEVFAWLFRKRGEFQRSQAALDKAAEIYAEAKVDPVLKEMVDEQANLELARGNAAQAHSLISSLIRRRRESGHSISLATPLITLAKIQIRLGDKKGANESLTEAESLARQWNMRYQLAETLLLASTLERDSERAAKVRAEGEQLTREEGFRFDIPSQAAATEITIASEPGPDLVARLFGPPRVHGDLGEASWPLKKALGIFCYLATSPSFSSSKDQLVDSFWGEDDFDVIERNFHPTLSFLRRSLRAVTAAGKNFIQFANGRYRLDPRYNYSIDIADFSRLITVAQRSARENKPDDAVQAFEQAIQLCQGPFMEGFDDQWVIARRSQFADDLHRGGLQFGTLMLERRRAAEVMLLAKKLFDFDPFDEMAAQLEMRARASIGDNAGVTAAYQRFESMLRAELGEPPSAATRKLYQELSNVGRSP